MPLVISLVLIFLMVFTLAYFLPLDLGTEDGEGEVFDPSKLDPDRCESCYGAETEDLK